MVELKVWYYGVQAIVIVLLRYFQKTLIAYLDIYTVCLLSLLGFKEVKYISVVLWV